MGSFYVLGMCTAIYLVIKPNELIASNVTYYYAAFLNGPWPPRDNISLIYLPPCTI